MAGASDSGLGQPIVVLTAVLVLGLSGCGANAVSRVLSGGAVGFDSVLDAILAVDVVARGFDPSPDRLWLLLNRSARSNC